MDLEQKILVTGYNGQLGFDCVRELVSRGYTNVKGIDIQDLDITDEKAVMNYILKYSHLNTHQFFYVVFLFLIILLLKIVFWYIKYIYF